VPPKIKYTDWSKEDLIRRIWALEKRKKYGLVWDEERTKEKFEANAEGKLPVLKGVKTKEIKTDADKPTHILVEGDNYHALSVLSYTHEKSIDIIYIDPPYNTGNKDFLYNDSYVDREDAYRHSKWLSFMSKRLRLARNLLKPGGLMFVSIDDNEMAQLKLLCDEIFGENNFRNSMVMSRVKKNIKERSLVKSLNVGYGAVFFYAKSDKALINIPTKYQPKKERWHAFDAPGIRSTMEYKLFGHKPPKGRHWMYEEGRAKELIKKGLLQENPRTGKPQYKLEASDVTMLDTNWSDLQEGDSKWKFETEKNVEFIKRLLRMYPSNQCTVLDCFAGSGTTSEAVLQLNEHDQGNRKFILATNNENNICEDFCYPRTKEALKQYGGGLRYYRTSFVPAEPTDKNKELLTKEAIEILCLRENTFKFVSETETIKLFENREHYTGIIFDQLDIQKFKKIATKLDKSVSVYVFSLGDDDFSVEFADMKNKVRVCSIPEAILRVYRRIFQ
jgi:adenine-specific DNA-methyltransferase